MNESESVPTEMEAEGKQNDKVNNEPVHPGMKHTLHIYVKDLHAIDYGDIQCADVIYFVKSLGLNATIRVHPLSDCVYSSEHNRQPVLCVVDGLLVNDFFKVYTRDEQYITNLFKDSKPALPPCALQQSIHTIQCGYRYVSDGVSWNVTSDSVDDIQDKIKDKLRDTTKLSDYAVDNAADKPECETNQDHSDMNEKIMVDKKNTLQVNHNKKKKPSQMR